MKYLLAFCFVLVSCGSPPQLPPPTPVEGDTPRQGDSFTGDMAPAYEEPRYLRINPTELMFFCELGGNCPDTRTTVLENRLGTDVTIGYPMIKANTGFSDQCGSSCFTLEDRRSYPAVLADNGNMIFTVKFTWTMVSQGATLLIPVTWDDGRAVLAVTLSGRMFIFP